MVNNLNNIKSLQMLRLWRQIPNPDHQFFLRHGISPHKALKNLSYSPEVQSVILARESAVVGDPWEIQGEKEEEVKFIKQMLEQLGINNIFKEIFHALWYGYTVLQHP
ncbi:MAG: phage portal protein family protein, partial [Brevinema sp.]